MALSLSDSVVTHQRFLIRHKVAVVLLDPLVGNLASHGVGEVRVCQEDQPDGQQVSQNEWLYLPRLAIRHCAEIKLPAVRNRALSPCAIAVSSIHKAPTLFWFFALQIRVLMN